MHTTSSNLDGGIVKMIETLAEIYPFGKFPFLRAWNKVKGELQCSWGNHVLLFYK